MLVRCFIHSGALIRGIVAVGLWQPHMVSEQLNCKAALSRSQYSQHLLSSANASTEDPSPGPWDCRGPCGENVPRRIASGADKSQKEEFLSLSPFSHDSRMTQEESKGTFHKEKKRSSWGN